MKVLRKIAILALCLAIILPIISSCVNDKPDEQTKLPEDTYVSMTQGINYTETLGDVTEYKVIISGLATESEKFAASELVSYVEQITGVTLEYTNDMGYTDDKIISVGETDFLSSSDVFLDKNALGADGFILKTKGQALIICGGSERGTIYGVYDFLEYHLGVKFLTDEYTYIPSADKAKVYACDRTEIPAFEYRVYLDQNAFYNKNAKFNVQSRFTSEYLQIPDNMGGNIKWFQDRPTHNSLFWAQVEKYVRGGKIAEEYIHAFANDGTNIVTAGVGGGEYTTYAPDLCFTDGINEDGSISLTAPNGTPTAIAMCIEGMKEVIRNDTGENNYYMFGQNDYAHRPCLCARCIEAAKKYEDSGILFRFVNALAREIEKFVIEEGIEREIKIVTFAYSWTAFAPVTKDAEGNIVVLDETCIPEDNVVVRLAPIGANHFYAYEHEAQDNTNYGSEYMKEWATIADDFMMWEYTSYYSRWYYFYPTVSSWHDKLVTARDMGISYLMYQSTFLESTIYQTVLERYIGAKMFWNPEYDVNEIIEDFHKHYFGEIAAPYVTEYIDVMTEACYTRLENNACNAQQALYYFDKGLLTSVISRLDKAISEIDASELSEADKKMYKERIELVKFQPRYMYLYNFMQYESDETAMKIYAKQLITEIMHAGGEWCIEGKRFDLENLVFS